MTMALAWYRSQNLLGTPLGLREEAVFLVGGPTQATAPSLAICPWLSVAAGQSRTYRFLKPHQAPARSL